MIELHYAHDLAAEDSSFMQLPCFLAPSPLHSAILHEENETELSLQEHSPPFSPDSSQELLEVAEARECQRREIYAYLSALHGGHFKKFAVRFGRALAA
jgi:hypothetical protein